LENLRTVIFALLPAIGTYLGALAIVRSDISKIEKKVSDLEQQIIEMKEIIKSKD